MRENNSGLLLEVQNPETEGKKPRSGRTKVGRLESELVWRCFWEPTGGKCLDPGSRTWIWQTSPPAQTLALLRLIWWHSCSEVLSKARTGTLVCFLRVTDGKAGMEPMSANPASPFPPAHDVFKVVDGFLGSPLGPTSTLTISTS